jgi:DNA modification methylase
VETVNKQIRVSCDPENRLRRIPLDELHPIQGELKEASVEDYQKFKALILKEGLDDAFDVWRELTPVQSKKKISQEGSTVIKWWILDGHLRKLMLTKMRDEEGYEIPDIPCKETEAVSIKHAKRKVLSKSAVFHKMRGDGLYKFMYDIDMSMSELKSYSLPHIELPKFEAEFYKDPAAVTNPVEGEDEVPEPPRTAHMRPGDLFHLAGHRLLCGDSTDATQVARLMNGEKADMVFTDPPYNVAGKTQMETLSKIRPNSYGKLKTANWDQDFDITTIFPSLEFVLSPNASAYVCCSHFLAGLIWHWMSEWGDYYGGCVWSKSNPMPSMHKRHWTWDHEHICYATKGKHVFNFPMDGHARATWAIAKSPSNSLHPTQKPVEVPEHAIKHSSNAGQLVTDLFLGSGSTLIACEKTNRKCYGMEIDPLYCDVILDRWAKFTGQDPKRSDGASWQDIKSAAAK